MNFQTGKGSVNHVPVDSDGGSNSCGILETFLDYRKPYVEHVLSKRSRVVISVVRPG